PPGPPAPFRERSSGLRVTGKTILLPSNFAPPRTSCGGAEGDLVAEVVQTAGKIGDEVGVVAALEVQILGKLGWVRLRPLRHSGRACRRHRGCSPRAPGQDAVGAAGAAARALARAFVVARAETL